MQTSMVFFEANWIKIIATIATLIFCPVIVLFFGNIMKRMKENNESQSIKTQPLLFGDQAELCQKNQEKCMVVFNNTISTIKDAVKSEVKEITISLENATNAFYDQFTKEYDTRLGEGEKKFAMLTSELYGLKKAVDTINRDCIIIKKDIQMDEAGEIVVKRWTAKKDKP